MSGGQIFALAIAAVAVVAAISIFAVAFRRGPAPPPTGKLDRRALAAERRREEERRPAAVAAAPAEEAPRLEEAAALPEPESVPDPLQARPEISEEEYGVTRRMFFTRSILIIFGVFLLQFALGSLAFMWPRLRAGAFGSAIDAGNIDEIRDQLFNADGSVTPFFVPAAQAYVLPFQTDVTTSQFEGTGVVVDDVMALWQRCVHLGCRVPWCQPSQGFECPCHGSKYNSHGEYEAGPAPRNMDRFVVTVDDSNNLVIDTGAVIQTARAKDKTVEYPQGPSCLA